MTRLLFCTVVLAASGCALVPRTACFPQGALTPEREERLTEALAAIGEPSPHDTNASGRVSFRLAILPSSDAFACVTLSRSGLDAMVLTIKLSSSVKVGGPQFDESRVLPDADWDAFLTQYDNLRRSAPTNLSPTLDDFFAEPGGTTFVLEGWYDGQYQVFQISDPRPVPFTPEAKAMLRQVFLDMDMSRLQEYVRAYVELLNWFAGQTDLSVLRQAK